MSVAGNANDGVTGPGETGWGIMTIDGNGRHGIHLSQNLQSIGGSLVLHDSGVSHDATNGLSATITNGSAVTLISASETLLGSNGADGHSPFGGIAPLDFS